jgi:hypothetical protein
MDFLVPYILEFAQKNPNVASILIIMAALRMVIKPIQDAARWYVSQTESVEDDKQLDEIEQSKWFKGLSWVLNYVASVKIK